ncbi:MAG: DNA alkylation repair protein [Bacteroidia bacterium]
MEPFKNVFNPKFFASFCKELKAVYPAFDEVGFTNQIFDDKWESRELKQRMRHTTLVLHDFLTQEYVKDLEILVKVAEQAISTVNTTEGLAYLFIPDYLEIYGIEHIEISLNAMKTITQLSSCEFAIRPFIIQYPNEVIPVLYEWARDENEHIRRLASEGSRPRLPWGQAIKALKQDPTPILKLLNLLKDDESEYVRRSVANNLNDISKDHAKLVIEMAESWIGQSKEVDWVVKHACRTLLKAGNQQVMRLFGYGSSNELKVTHFKITNPNVSLGEYVNFEFYLINCAKEDKKVRLEYATYFLLKNGEHSRKVFKISEKEYAAESTTKIERRQHFKPITTRVYYPGLHKIAIIVNGVEYGEAEFKLVI